MSFSKQIKDWVIKMTDGQAGQLAVRELRHYFTIYGPIRFTVRQEGGLLVAVSANFHHGNIVTYGKEQKELDQNIEDAILTAFDVPAVYKQEAHLQRLNSEEPLYAVA